MPRIEYKVGAAPCCDENLADDEGDEFGRALEQVVAAASRDEVRSVQAVGPFGLAPEPVDLNLGSQRRSPGSLVIVE